MQIPGGKKVPADRTTILKECQGPWEERACCVLAVVLRMQEECSRTPDL